MYEVSVELGVEEDVDVAGLRRLAEVVMAGEGVAVGTALAILVTDDEQIRSMNRQFLGIDEPTDVLSFPDEADDFVQGVAGDVLLGDIAISLPTARRQAEANGIGLDLELAHLLVHGVLHLCGWDHVENADAEAAMRTREEHYVPGVKHSEPH
ncbi:MAG: rRNA maturation RNase YbeY [Dehalococcoidia bacterium]